MVSEWCWTLWEKQRYQHPLWHHRGLFSTLSGLNSCTSQAKVGLSRQDGEAGYCWRTFGKRELLNYPSSCSVRWPSGSSYFLVQENRLSWLRLRLQTNSMVFEGWMLPRSFVTASHEVLPTGCIVPVYLWLTFQMNWWFKNKKKQRYDNNGSISENVSETLSLLKTQKSWAGVSDDHDE